MFSKSQQSGLTAAQPHINPRYRAYGRARIDIAQRAQTRQDWERMWKQPQYDFPFVWGEHWKQCVEYKVDDFAAEVGFFIDVLALPVKAFNPDYAMFTGPDESFYFAVSPTPPDEPSTPPDAIRLQFMVADIYAVVDDLQRRGVSFVRQPTPITPGSSQYVAALSTPHGLSLEIWGMVAVSVAPQPGRRHAAYSASPPRIQALRERGYAAPPVDADDAYADELDETFDGQDEQEAGSEDYAAAPVTLRPAPVIVEPSAASTASRGASPTARRTYTDPLDELAAADLEAELSEPAPRNLPFNQRRRPAVPPPPEPVWAEEDELLSEPPFPPAAAPVARQAAPRIEMPRSPAGRPPASASTRPQSSSRRAAAPELPAASSAPSGSGQPANRALPRPPTPPPSGAGGRAAPAPRTKSLHAPLGAETPGDDFDEDAPEYVDLQDEPKYTYRPLNPRR